MQVEVFHIQNLRMRRHIGAEKLYPPRAKLKDTTFAPLHLETTLKLMYVS